MYSRSKKMVEMALQIYDKSVQQQTCSSPPTNDGVVSGNNDSFADTESTRVEQVLPEINEILDLQNDEPFDDSDADPTYQPFPSPEKESSDEENMCSDIEEMAVQLEINLTNEAGTSKETQKTRKRKRNAGESYHLAKGGERKSRECMPLTNCRKQCKIKIDDSDQKTIFLQYWALGNYNLRTAYVSGLIELNEKKSQKITTTPVRNRRFECKYFLKINGKRVEVCLKCFKSTLGETDKFVRNITNKMFLTPGAESIIDLRGKHSAKFKCLPENIIDAVKAHINSFPSYESHYTRRDSSQKYLHADLTLAQMYKLYAESQQSPVSIWKYTKVFQSMNIKFKKPSLDQCNTCETLRLKIQFSEGDEKIKLEEQRRIHHLAADTAYKQKDNDKTMAKADSTIKLYTFDMQKCLPTPYLNTSISFYKRALWTYNVTIHDCVSNQAYNHMWHEAIGNRGGNEVASCLLSHLQTLPLDVKRIILYSDSCVGQNKNSFVASMLMVFLSNSHHVEVIDHKFLEVGHTHMECDSDHAVIEKQKKRTSFNIHHPRDWYQFVRSVRSYKQYLVTEMTSNNIYDFAQIAKTKMMWRNIDAEGNKFAWHSVKWLRYTTNFGIVQYKNSLDNNETFKTLNVGRRGITQIKLQDVVKCYTGPVKIAEQKKKDLLDLLPLIAPEYHSFYSNLLTQGGPDIHPDLLDESEEN